MAESRYRTTYDLPEAKHFVRRWETACNFTEVEVSAGSYPIRYTRIDGRDPYPGDEPYYGMVALPGVITDESVTNRLFQFSSTVNGGPNIGKPDTIHLQIYAYLLLVEPAGIESS